jgi:hypothetical protein
MGWEFVQCNSEVAVDGGYTAGFVPFEIVCLPVVQIDSLFISQSLTTNTLREGRTSQYGSSITSARALQLKAEETNTHRPARMYVLDC